MINYILEFTHPSGWRHCFTIGLNDYDHAKIYAENYVRFKTRDGYMPKSNVKITYHVSALSEYDLVKLYVSDTHLEED